MNVVPDKTTAKDCTAAEEHVNARIRRLAAGVLAGSSSAPSEFATLLLAIARPIVARQLDGMHAEAVDDVLQKVQLAAFSNARNLVDAVKIESPKHWLSGLIFNQIRLYFRHVR